MFLNILFFSLLSVATIFIFISELVSPWIRILEASVIRNSCGSIHCFLGLENSGFTRKHGFSLDIPCLFVKVRPQCEPSRSRFSRNLRVFWQSFRISPLISISWSHKQFHLLPVWNFVHKFSFTGVHDKVQYVYRTYIILTNLALQEFTIKCSMYTEHIILTNFDTCFMLSHILYCSVL